MNIENHKISSNITQMTEMITQYKFGATVLNIFMTCYIFFSGSLGMCNNFSTKPSNLFRENLNSLNY